MDTFLKTKEREFPISLSWHDSKIEAYLLRIPMLGLSPAFLPTETGTPTMNQALCMLSFEPDVAFPRLEGTMDDLYGKAEKGTASEALRRRLLDNNMMTLPYELTFAEPSLAGAFKRPPIAKDGKVMFEFGEIETTGILDVGGGSAYDMGGRSQEECERELQDVSPKISARLSNARLLKEVKSIGQARIIPLSQ